MYFKKLELLGFKSFADKVDLRFESGITAIVGPNGCGKTNISDAIMWVLGEQSAKQLRGSKMGDIIFNGSSSRQPLSMAEVSLTLDNSQNVIPVDYGEVTITRRMFRSGETQYFINKTPCRLKDIAELFMDTGIGTDAYSIIEESKIDLILSSKSEDRRFLFEEAAGIMKYKSRKNEALHKLEKTEQNLVRLGDILTEIKSRVSSLDYQVRKARQYQKYKQTLKTIEIELLNDQLRELTNSLAFTAEEFNDVRDEIEKLNVSINTQEADVSKIKLELTELDEKTLAVGQDLSKITGELERKEERISNLQEKKETLSIEESKLKEKIKLDEEKTERVKERNIALEEEIEELNRDITTGEAALKEKEGVLKTQNREIEGISKSLDSVKDATFNLLNEISHRKNEVTTLSVTLKNIKMQQDKLKGEERNLESLTADVEGRIESARDNISTQEEQLRNELQSKKLLKREIEEKEKSHYNLNEEFENIKQEFNIKSSRYEFLQKLQANFEGYDAGVKEILNSNFTGIHATVASIVDVKAEYEVAIEEVLGNKLQYIIAQDINSARNAIRYLKEENKGRVNFLVLDNFINYKVQNRLNIENEKIIAKGIDLVSFNPKYRAVMDYLLGDVLVVDNLEAALEISKDSDFNGRTVTLKGELLEYISGTTTLLRGGSRIGESGFLGRKREIRELKEFLPGISENINRLKTDREGLEQNLKAKKLELEKINLSIQKLEVILDNSRESHKELQNEIEKIRKQKETLSIEQIQWHKEHEETNTALADVNNLLVELEKNNSENQDNINRLEKELHDKSNLNISLNETITTIKVNLAQKGQKRESLLYEIKRAKEELNEVINSLEDEKRDISSIDQKVVELGNIKTEEDSYIERLISEKDHTEKLVNEARENRQQLMDSLNEQESSVKAQRSQIEARKAAFHQKELKNTQINTHIEDIKKRLTEDFGIKEENIDLQTPAEIDVEEKKLEVAKLKKKIESMGAVNLVAIDEYQELEERYKFLIKQQEDLIKAKDDLHKVIDKTNTTARSHFKETFEKVRVNFIEICRQLFEGGEADLVLSSPDNLLDTGIEIIVQPPGKKLQSISLLSAGERALTAIALLFAIFMVKPSPFCLLDEIDAPLDEANLQRFARMLREFSRNSQFIVITHNKRTMGIADILYGVTMEEFGVSKLVSVKLKEEQTIEAVI